MSFRRVLVVVISAVFASLLMLSATAGAVDNPDYTSPPPSTVVTTPPPAAKVTTAVNAAPARTRLAITGRNVGATVAIGVSLLGVGAATMVARRRLAA